MSAPTTHSRATGTMPRTLRRTGLLLLLAASGGASAAGFAVDTQGARATGLATAVAGHIDDPSAIYYNPAGIVHAEGLQIQLGDTLIFPNIHFTPAGGGPVESTAFSISPPPHLYATYRPMEMVAFGLGLSTPFGANSKWPEGWSGAQLTQSASLALYDLSAVGAVSLLDRVRLGASFRVMRGTVEIKRELNFVDSTGRVELGGAGWGLAYSVGAQVDVVPKMLTLGVNYRSGTSVDFDGRAHFEAPVEFGPMLRDQPISSKVELPAFLLMGLAWNPLENLVVEFDAHLVQWSSFKELRFEFEDPALTNVVPKDWGDAWSYHLGGEYRLDALSLRLGAVFDTTPSPESTLTPDLPDSDRFKITAGLGYQLGAFTGDLGYQFVILLGKDSTAPGFPGRYSGDAHVVGITLGAKL